MATHTLKGQASDADIGSFIDLVRTGEQPPTALLALLSESHPVYQQRSASRVTQILGYAMASFGQAGTPKAALPHLLDALESGREPYLVAAAARGLRGVEEPNEQLANYLLQAIENIRYHDDSLCLDELLPEWPVRHATSAMKEIATSFAWLRGNGKSAIAVLQRLSSQSTDFSPSVRMALQQAARAIEEDDRPVPLDCCALPEARHRGIGNAYRGSRWLQRIRHIELENEKGQKGTVGSELLGKPTVIGFFYTRCMNPHKCSLTIAKLGQLQRILEAERLSERVNIAAITYDPTHDTAGRIDVFCTHRGLSLGEHASGYRIDPEHFESFRDFFELGVGYTGSVVNQHRLELFLVDHRGKVQASYLRLQWQVEAVAADLRRLAERAGRPSFGVPIAHVQGLASVSLSVLVALVPKCPLCWASYLSAFGVVGLGGMPYTSWALPLSALAMAVNLAFLYRGAPYRNGKAPFFTSVAGALLLLLGQYGQMSAMLWFGMAFVTSGALLNSLPRHAFLRLQRTFSAYRQHPAGLMN